MDLQQSSDEIDDDAELDRELRAALRINPSPEFLARVRGRLADGPPPRRWNGSPLFGLGAAAAAAMIVASLALRHQMSAVAPAGENRSAAVVNHLAVPGPLQPPAIVTTPTVPAPRRSVPRVPATALGQDSAIILSTVEGRAIRALIDAARAGAIAMTPLIVDDRSDQPIQDLLVPPITVQPVTIEPLLLITQ
jgi:hypothetical protein